MGDIQDETVNKKSSEVVIELTEAPLGRQPQQQNRQNAYYSNQTYQNQTPTYYQRQVGGQPVYVVGEEPRNVSRGQPAYIANYPGRQDENAIFLDPEIFTDSFNTVQIRNRFVQRVYSILSVQLLFSFGLVVLITFEDNTREVFIKNGFIFLIIGMAAYITGAIALTCCSDLRRNYPINFMMLAILTIGMTLILGALVALTPPIIVLCALGTTALVCVVVSLFAIQTRWDVTTCGMCLCIAMIVLLIYGFILMILLLIGIYIPILHIIYSALACLLFVFWLMYDTQMIVGGRRIELSPEEYIFGALTLYIDIVIIFMHIMTLYHYCMGGE